MGGPDGMAPVGGAYAVGGGIEPDGERTKRKNRTGCAALGAAVLAAGIILLKIIGAIEIVVQALLYIGWLLQNWPFRP